MKSLSLFSLLLVALFSGGPALDAGAAAQWQSDLAKAQTQAKAENKAILINFTGSDWCGWCIRLRKEVFNKSAFEEYAVSNLVLVEIDFPRQKAQPDSVKRANRALADKFEVEGYPTIIVLNGEGKKVGQLGYMPGGPKAFLAELSKVIDKRPASETPVQARTPAPPAQTTGKNGKAAKGTPAAPWPPTQVEGLVLKGISGPREKRMALVNNQSLGQGETASVKIPGGTLRVHCLEIREGSVLVKIDGREGQHELKLWTGL